MELDRPQIDIGLFTNRIEAMKAFYAGTLKLEFESELSVSDGFKQHRYIANGSIIKLNEARDPLPSALRLGSRRRARGTSTIEMPSGSYNASGQESEAAWRELVQSLVARHLGTPALAVIAGNPGLQAALLAQWSQIAIQRCTNHKLRNLLAKASAHLREELAEDYRPMVYAETREGSNKRERSFVRKWRLRCKAVISSSKEPVRSGSPFCSSPDRSGKPCALPTRSSASMASFADGPKLMLVAR
jgi:hypothetical protein